MSRVKWGILLFTVSFIFSTNLNADPLEGMKFEVSGEKLQALQRLVAELDNKLALVLRDYNDKEVMPRDRDRRLFTEEMGRSLATLRGPNGLADLLKTSMERPIAPENEFKAYMVRSFWIVGSVDSKDQAEALNSHRRECDVIGEAVRGIFATNTIDSINCGTPANVSPYISSGYFQFASAPTVVLKIPARWSVRQADGGNIGGNRDSKNPAEAYSGWWPVCNDWIKNQRQAYGQRFLAAACGEPRNVSAYSKSGYIQYASQGIVYVKD